MTGLTIELQIAYTNKIKLDGTEVRASISVQKAPISWSGLGGATDYTSYVPGADGATMSTLETYSYGVKLVVSAAGSIGRFDIWSFFAIVSQFIVYRGRAALAPARKNTESDAHGFELGRRRYLGISSLCGEWVAYSFLGEKSNKLYHDQRDYRHCTRGRAESLSFERDGTSGVRRRKSDQSSPRERSRPRRRDPSPQARITRSPSVPRVVAAVSSRAARSPATTAPRRATARTPWRCAPRKSIRASRAPAPRFESA